MGGDGTLNLRLLSSRLTDVGPEREEGLAGDEEGEREEEDALHLREPERNEVDAVGHESSAACESKGVSGESWTSKKNRTDRG